MDLLLLRGDYVYQDIIFIYYYLSQIVFCIFLSTEIQLFKIIKVLYIYVENYIKGIEIVYFKM